MFVDPSEQLSYFFYIKNSIYNSNDLFMSGNNELGHIVYKLDPINQTVKWKTYLALGFQNLLLTEC